MYKRSLSLLISYCEQKGYYHIYIHARLINREFETNIVCCIYMPGQKKGGLSHCVCKFIQTS